MKSLLQELQNMSISDLQFICKEMGINYNGNKNSLISKLLFTL